MEYAALVGLAGLAYAVKYLSEPESQQLKQQQKAPISIKNKSKLTEAFSASTKKGGSAQGSNQELGLMYATPGGQVYPSEISPGPKGTAFSYATTIPSAGNQEGFSPSPQPIESATPQVQMNSGGLEANATYVDGNYVMSQLSGEKLPSKEFKHNNMNPFFGGRVRQNVAPNTNSGILDSYVGAGNTVIAKKEVESMFDTAKTPFGNPFGMEDNTEFVQTRINAPRSRAGERPFEPVRVAPGVGEKFGSTGKGGFQQMEVNGSMMKLIRRTDDLRTADNPKLTYDQPVIPGSHFIGEAMQNPGEVRKYRPDTFFIDETGERYIGAFASDAQKETARPVQVMKHVNRPETTTEYTGPASSQAFGETYVTGSYRSPMVQQYGGAGYRNADGTGYFGDVDAEQADYGRSSIEMRPNERSATGERTMGLNLVPADTGAMTVHYDDPSRPTRREETSGNIRQTGTATGYAAGAPAITVWDPNDVARTTVKETTINWGVSRFGPAVSSDGPKRLKVYDPDDIARPTQKAQISAKSEYYGASVSANKDFTSHESAYNMRTNAGREKIAKGRRPIAGNGNVAVFTGEKNGVTYKKLDTDSVNDRANAVNRVSSIPTGSADLGQVKYRTPLKLDVSLERNGREMISAVENNPLQQSLSRNAQHDENLLQEMLQSM